MSCGKVKQNTLTDTFRKKRRRKTAKKKKRKRTAPPAWRSGLSRFCLRKLCPQGVIFDGQTAQPPDLDGPTETGYLCGSFCFWMWKNSRQILIKLFFLCGSPTGLKLCKFSQNPEDICLRLEVKPEILCRPNLLKAL